MNIERLQDRSFEGIKMSKDEEIKEARLDIERTIETFMKKISSATCQGLFRTGYIVVENSSSDAVLGYFEKEGLYVRREKVLFFNDSIDLSWDPRDIKKLRDKRPKILEWLRKSHWINWINFEIGMYCVVIAMMVMIIAWSLIVKYC